MALHGVVLPTNRTFEIELVTARILKWSIAWVGLILARFVWQCSSPHGVHDYGNGWSITTSRLVIGRSAFQLRLIRTLPSLRSTAVVFVAERALPDHLAQHS